MIDCYRDALDHLKGYSKASPDHPGLWCHFLHRKCRLSVLERLLLSRCYPDRHHSPHSSDDHDRDRFCDLGLDYCHHNRSDRHGD